MKRFIASLAILLGFMGNAYNCHATHFFRNNAGNINSGILDSARLDPSSVTMLGPNPSFTAFSGGGAGCTLVVGTVNAVNVDMRIANQSDFNLVLARIGGRGITFTSTITATVCMKDGIYPLTDVTVPQGVTFQGIGSSAVIVDVGATSDRLINIAGSVRNVNFDLSGQAFTVNKIQLSSGSVFGNNTIYGTRNQVQSASLYIKGNEIRVFGLQYLEQPSIQGISRFGDSGGLAVEASSNVIIQISKWFGVLGAGNPSNFGIIGSSGVRVINSDIDFAGGNGIIIQDGSMNCSIENTRIRTVNSGTLGVIVIGQDTGNSQSVSSSTILRNIDIILPDSDPGVAIVVGGAATTVKGLSLDNINIKGMSSSGTYLKLNGTAFNTTINSVKAQGQGTFLNDSGKGTAQSGNYLNGISQDVVAAAPTTTSGAFPRMYDVYIGTPGTPGVDYNGTSIATMTNQAYSDRFIGGGSTNTKALSVFFRPGIYGGNNSTCPANVYWYTVPNPSGTIYSMENDSASITTIYGTVDGFVFDLDSRPFTGEAIRMMSKSRLKNFTIIGAQAMANYTSGAIISVKNASDVVTSDGWFKEWHGCAGQVFQGNCAAYRIMDSTAAMAYNIKWSTPAYFASLYETAWSTVRSKQCSLIDNRFDGVTGEVVSVGTGRDTVIKRNTFFLGAGSQGDGPNYGTITIDGSDEPVPTGPSTMTVISDNFFTFVSTGGAQGRIIRSRSYATPPGLGIKITGNQVSSERRSNWIFYHQNGGTVFNTIITDNIVDNLETFYSATGGGGVGDLYQSVGNIFNGKEQ